MKVLILHQHFKTPQTGGAIRSYYLATALAGKGIKAVVITAHNEPGYRQETVDGIEVHYLPVSYDNRFGFYRRLLSFYRFIRMSVRLASRHRDAAICYTISTPLTTGLAARTIRRRYNIPYIFEVGDLWPDAPVEMGFIRNPLLKKILYRMEKSIYEGATSIVALSPPIREVVGKKAGLKTIHLLPNMSDTDFFTDEEKRPALKKQFDVEGKFVVSYIGAMGFANGLRHLLDCAAEAGSRRLAVHFLLCGDGAMVDELKRYAARLALDNVSFIPFRNRQGVLEVMNVTDACFTCYRPDKILETGSPNKYFDGIAAGKLSIINFGGWIREEVECNRSGVYVDPARPGDFALKIAPFLEDPQLLKQYQRASRALAVRAYSRRMLGDRYVAIVGSVNSGMRNKPVDD